jgi:hypothetical protein
MDMNNIKYKVSNLSDKQYWGNFVTDVWTDRKYINKVSTLEEWGANELKLTNLGKHKLLDRWIIMAKFVSAEIMMLSQYCKLEPLHINEVSKHRGINCSFDISLEKMWLQVSSLTTSNDISSWTLWLEERPVWSNSNRGGEEQINERYYVLPPFCLIS